MKAIDRYLFREDIVVTSHPIGSGGRWSIIRGDRREFSIEEFPSEAEARRSSGLIADAVSLGAGMVRIRVVVLSAEQARRAVDRASYQAVVEEECRRLAWPAPAGAGRLQH